MRFSKKEEYLRQKDRKLKKINDLDLATVIMKTKKGSSSVLLLI